MHIFSNIIQKQIRPVTRLCLVLSVAVAAGCTSDWPDIDVAPSAAARAAPDPQLLTGTEISAALGPGGTDSPEKEAESLAARAEALKARAAQLDGAVISTPEARRLRDAACARDATSPNCQPTN